MKYLLKIHFSRQLKLLIISNVQVSGIFCRFVYMLVKRIASICFAVAFLMAMVLFARVGTDYISIPTARIVFMAAGAAALVLNLFSFQKDKNSNPSFNLIFWVGSVVLFIGLVLQFLSLPYHQFVVIAGLGITGISFFLSPTLITGKSDDSDLLDDPKNHS